MDEPTVAGSERHGKPTTGRAAAGSDNLGRKRLGRKSFRRCRRKLARAGVAVLTIVGLSGLLLPHGPQVGAFASAAAQRDFSSRYDAALALLPPPQRSLDVPTSFGVVRVYEWVPAGMETTTPVLLVPGRAAPVSMWRENLPHLLRSHRVLAIDAVGDLGRSVQTVPLQTMDDQATWLGEVIDAVGTGPVHLVGHSFGGATAAALAVRRPEVVSTLTLLEPIFTLGSPPASLYLWASLLTLPVPDSWRERALREIGGVESVDRSDPIAALIDVGSRSYTARLPTPRVLDDGTLASLPMPVYVGIGGADSLAGGRDAAARAERLIPTATVVVWSSATHSLPFQVAEPLALDLDAFWAQSEQP